MKASTLGVPMAAMVLLLSGCRTRPAEVTPNPEFGSFNGAVQAEWKKDGRGMFLLRELIFQDLKQNTIWTAPKSARIDGASIPKVFWSLLSGPYEGLYREASVSHDYETCMKTNSWKKVHRMFYNAMRAQGESPARAKLMYLAVYHFGPRWPRYGFTATTDPDMAAPRATLTEADAKRAQLWLEREPNTSLEEIENTDAPKIRARLAEFGFVSMEMSGFRDDVLVPTTRSDAPCIEGS